jgi:hypothetical protein
MISPDQFTIAQDTHQATHTHIALGQFHCGGQVSAGITSVPRADCPANIAHEDEFVLFHARNTIRPQSQSQGFSSRTNKYHSGGNPSGGYCDTTCRILGRPIRGEWPC